MAEIVTLEDLGSIVPDHTVIDLGSVLVRPDPSDELPTTIDGKSVDQVDDGFANARAVREAQARREARPSSHAEAV